VADTITPSTFEAVAEALRTAASALTPVRVTGACTKLGWGGASPAQATRLQMVALSRIASYDADSMTATIEAGTPLGRAQRQLASHGLQLALDPPGIDAGDHGPTLGGVFATNDAGPLRHRYGPPSEQILSARVALSDGTTMHVPRPLAQLFTGSFGTLGVLLSVTVRLHPAHAETCTGFGASDEPLLLRDTVRALVAHGTAWERLDVAWRNGRGGILAQTAGQGCSTAAGVAAGLMRRAGLQEVGITESDAPLWARERAGQRSRDRAVLLVTLQPEHLAELLRLADACDATVVSRAALGINYLTLNVNRIARLRAGLPSGASATVLDLPVSARGVVEPWGPQDAQRLELMRAIKHQFDGAGICNPGIFVGGI
jgi:glycolate oxidase FAD binding subunit